MDLLAVPAGHNVHAAEPIVALYDPALQIVHLPPLPEVPALHTHWSSEVLCEGACDNTQEMH